MRITRIVTGGAAAVLAWGVLLALSGCLVSGSASQKRTGKYVSDATMARIEPGKTTAGWVMATMGEPSSRNKMEDGSEVWRWDYTETRHSTAAVFLIFGGSDEKQNDGSVFVEMKDGVVVNKWRA
jgi:outer membrane protein assembly factor BamE (lipoprotein component of BamABCDE complex)